MNQSEKCRTKDILIVVADPRAEAEAMIRRLTRYGFASQIYESLCEEVRDDLVVVTSPAFNCGQAMIFCRAA